MVGLPGLEPGTSVLSGLRSNRLSYRPIFAILATKTGCFRCFLNPLKMIYIHFISIISENRFLRNTYYTLI